MDMRCPRTVPFLLSTDLIVRIMEARVLLKVSHFIFKDVKFSASQNSVFKTVRTASLEP